MELYLLSIQSTARVLRNCPIFFFQLKSGMAEVFGTELVKGKGYVFTTGAKIAVFTWQGCVIELRGKTDVSYVAKETPVVS